MSDVWWVMSGSRGRSRITDHCSLFLQRLVDDVRQRGVAVEDVYVEPLFLERTHGIKAFLLAWPAPAHPDSHVLELAVRLSLPETVDDAAEGLFHIGEIGDGSADDDILDAGQRADFFCQHFDGPVGGVAG